DFKRRRSQRAGRAVTATVGIDQTISVETIYGHLIWQCAMRRAGAKRITTHPPCAVIGSFEILNRNISALSSGCDQSDQANQREDDFEFSHFSCSSQSK